MFTTVRATLSVLLMAALLSACSANKGAKVSAATSAEPKKDSMEDIPLVYEKRSPKKQKPTVAAGSFNDNLSKAALERLRSRVRYDGAYVKIAYPWGDVHPSTGVCTDVVIRSYRKLGYDLQEQVHRDISSAFHTYPNPRKWGLDKPDPNIDHRRVYNLRKFFQRQGAALPITRDPKHYKPGDLVTWMVGPDLPHIGIVVNKRSKADPNRFMIVHNIAHGPQLEDVLFAFPITGHYRYTPRHMENVPKGIFVQRARRGMSNSELMHAAKILGADKQQPSVSPKTIKQVIAETPAAEKKLTLAGLANTEAEAILQQ